MMSGCAWHDDGRHRWRFAVSRFAGTPYYGCGPSCGIVLPTGDGVADDVRYLRAVGGGLVTSCARCDREGEVDRGILLVDVDGNGEVDTAVCSRCASIDPVRLARDLAERYGVRCEGCGEACGDDEVDRYRTPVGMVDLCHTCGPDDADTRAELAAIREEAAAIA
jgi:hypothetical protein